jgi:hypothetical protein
MCLQILNITETCSLVEVHVSSQINSCHIVASSALRTSQAFRGLNAWFETGIPREIRAVVHLCDDLASRKIKLCYLR